MSPKRAILLFGAGINQRTLIEAARELGLVSIVLDPSPNAPARHLADVFYAVAGNDYERTKAIAVAHQVAGIATAQMENPMRLMARLAAELGFIFHTPEIAERSIDKWLMKQAFQKAGVPCAQGILLRGDDKDVSGVTDRMAFPMIVKPKDSHSSKGVFKVDAADELAGFLPPAGRFSSSGQVIVEEFLEGPEYSVEAITFQGVTTIIQITEKFVTPLPYRVELGHLQPAPLSPDEKAAVEHITVSAIQAIGIDNSASHTEVKLTAQGPKVIEIGARLGGDFISSYLTRTSCGVNMDKAVIQAALGEQPDLEKKWNRHACIRYFQLPEAEKVLQVLPWEHVLDAPEVVYAHINVQPGEIIPPITESKNRPGFVIIEAGSRDAALAVSDKYAALLAGCVRTEKAAVVC